MDSNHYSKKICIVTTVSITMKSFVVETAKYLYEKSNYDVTLICAPDDAFAASLPKKLHYIPVKMGRGIDVSALRSIKELKKIFQREKFDMVQYSTPNASFYASFAAKSARIPIRLYCQWGIRYTAFSGFSRKLFKLIEKITCRNSTEIRSVSPLNMQFGIEEGLYTPEKVSVVGNGGTIGVDTVEYNINEKSTWRREVREKFGIVEDILLFGFVGRVSTDKGCCELFSAFRKLSEEDENVMLMIVGPIEEINGIDEELIGWVKSSKKVVSVGMVPNIEMRKFYASMDILVHPTYREGFGMVIQEAGALGIPVITTKIIGASEVMEADISCLLVKPKNKDDLYNAMRRLSCDKSLIERLGKMAYERTIKLYERSIMLENQRADYEKLMKD